MKILFSGFLLFLIGFLLHIILWKVYLPKNQNKTLIRIFFYTLFVYSITSCIAAIHLRFNPVILPVHFSEYLHICLLYVCLSLSYLVFYSVIESDSPTITMILNINKTGRSGLSSQELAEFMSIDLLIKPRIEDLLRDKMIEKNHDKYRLTKTGYCFASIFKFYRMLLNAQKGG